VKLATALLALLLLAVAALAPEPPTLAQLLEKAFAPPAPEATLPGRFILHTSAGILYRLDTATGSTWEQTTQLLPTGSTLNAWSRVSESAITMLMAMDKLKPAKPFNVEEIFKAPPRKPIDFTKP